MRKITNRDRILDASIELFNQSGVVAITTNHIASHLRISPGNLYFHFRNKEEIICELFDRMCDDLYAVWMPNKRLDANASPIEIIERTFDVFWKYRFFHREMYHLRRKDPVLARKWKAHIKKTVRLMTAMYGLWVKANVMKQVRDPAEMRMISDVVLITSSTFLQFYESPTRPATRKPIRDGINHILRFLLPYYTDPMKAEVLARLRSA